jgi:CO/xanthine dehydrogenase FAD-binding subunit
MSNYVGLKNLPAMTYHRPESLEEALRLLEELPGESRVIAGGTDFIPSIRRGKWSFPDGLNLIDLRRVAALRYIEQEGDVLRIGAATRLSDILRTDRTREAAPLLWEAVNDLASFQVRNSATLGGNLCTASPAADTAPPLLALEASAKIVTSRGEVLVPLTDFFLGPGRTILGKTDVLAEVRFPMVSPETKYRWLKLGRRGAFTLSVVSVAMCIRMHGGKYTAVRIALGAVAPTVLRARQAEEYLTNRPVDSRTIEQAARIATGEVRPISDVRASAAYRREMVYALISRGMAYCSEG